YLVNTTLDFSDGLNGKGFYFSNPNASRSCGCGESFGV
ncbi:MAG: iron-sulfur cluster assembly accessory protein, partial [Bacteroidota bacterium]|nr:iron-sulfur cluster assembly accessory protein [Bacteroidota bacterium]